MKLAIIGASYGQKPLCEKAKEMGLNTICFSWPQGAVCKDVVDRFYPISIIDKDTIVDVCKAEHVDGVVSNASDLTAEVVSYVATCLGLHGNNYRSFQKLKDKSMVRELTDHIKDLRQVRTFSYFDSCGFHFPCVAKPKIGTGKKGVCYVCCEKELEKVVGIESHEIDSFIIEEYVSGKEISIETISFEGKHYIIQITDKENTGAPHFVELAHHQPTSLCSEVINKIVRIVPRLLDAIDFSNGASHIEMKVNSNNELYLIEINPRGGGDEISNKLVQLSTGYDYVKGMIDVALGQFDIPVVQSNHYAGIYYLCKQTEYLLPIFKKNVKPAWLVELSCKTIDELHTAMDNYSRDGYFIYQSEHKVVFNKNTVSYV